MLGWMQYLDMKMATMFVSVGADKPIALMNKKLHQHGLRVACFETFERPFLAFTEAGFRAPKDELVRLFRFSYDIEQRLTKVVGGAAKAGNSEGAKAALDYQRLVNNGTLFARSPVERLLMLYDAYKDHPTLSPSVAVEIGGARFDPQSGARNTAIMDEALIHGVVA